MEQQQSEVRLLAISDLNILIKNIEDRPDNATRFLVVGRNVISRVAMIKPQLLFQMMIQKLDSEFFINATAILTNKINITRIESRPSHKIGIMYFSIWMAI